MSESLTLYITSHKTGELLGTRDAQRDIKQPARFVVPPYQTPDACPNETLSDKEYWALLDSNDEPVRNYQDGTWVKKKRQKKVTAYNKQTLEPKDFDDKTLVNDEHTLKKPLPYSAWQKNDWVQQIKLLQDAKHREVNQWRNEQEADDTTIVDAIGYRWDANPSARNRIDSTLLGGLMPPYWTDADNVDHELTIEDLKQIKASISQLGFDIHHRQRTMKAEIEAMLNFDELEAYVVGWPQ